MITIGANTYSTASALTNKERLVLNTNNEPNMIVLRSSNVPNINMSFNDSNIFGINTNDTSFYFNTNSSSCVLNLNVTSNVSYSPTYVSNNLFVTGNAVVNGNLGINNLINTPSLVTCNVRINVDPVNTTTYLNVKNGNSTYITADTNNNITINGKIKLNTTTIQAGDSISISGNANVVGNITASSSVNTTQLVSTSLDATTNRFFPGIKLNSQTIDPFTKQRVSVIEFDSNIYIPGNLYNNNFIVTNLGLSTLSVSSNTDLTAVTCSNTIANPKPPLTVRYNSTASTSDVLDIFIDSNIAMSLDKRGCFKLASSNIGRGMIDVNYSSNVASNMLAFSGVNPYDLFYISSNANLGIGTSNPGCALQIVRQSDHTTNNAFIGLYDYTNANYTSNTGFGPFLSAYTSNGTCVTYIDKNGNATFGNTSYDSNWTLNVSSNLKVPVIQTNSIYSSNNLIDFGQTTLSNVNGLYTNNYSTCNINVSGQLNTNYIMASNFSIIGLDIFQPPDYTSSTFRLKGYSYIFTGAIGCWSPNINDIQRDPINEGKFKIVTSSSSDSTVSSVGMNVIGPGRNSVRVTSANPVFELYYQVGTTPQGLGFVAVDQSSMFLSYNSSSSSTQQAYSTKQIQLTNSSVKLFNNVVVTTDARMSINLADTNALNNFITTPTAPKLLVRGTTQILDTNSTPILTVNELNGRVGIGTSSPLLNTLHVNGGIYQANGNNSINGITTFTSNVIYNNAPLVSSQWSASNSNVYLVQSNVGIGTSTPQSTFHNNGRSIFGSNNDTFSVIIDRGSIGIGTTQPRAAIDIVNSNLIVSGSGYVGIGTTSPSSALQVQGTTFITSNTGIGTTPTSQFALNVGGDINFNGQLYQNSSRYVSSQWTTTTSGCNVYFLSNVGIGTTSPSSALQVQGSTYITSNTGIGAVPASQFVLNVGGDINFNGQLYQNNSRYASSQWLNTSSGCNVYFLSNVGIGTTSPSSALQVQGTTYITSNTGIGTVPTSQFSLNVGGDINFNGQLYQNSSRYVSSQWANTATGCNVYFLSNVGIGTTNPLYKLHIDTGNCYFSSNVTVGGVLNAARSVATTSDIRVKTDLKVINDSMDIISSLTGYKYYRTDTKTNDIGLIAQDVRNVCPELVGDDGNLLNISYGNMAAVFVEAIKTLNTKINNLEEELKSLRLRL